VKNNYPVTPTRARGAAIGAGILTFFGAFWAFAALINWPQAPTWAYIIVALIIAALALFSATRFVAAAKLPPAQDAAQAAQRGRTIGIWFGIIFAVEALFIAIAASLLARAGRLLLIPLVVAAAVKHLLRFPNERCFGCGPA
jgi:hypothetical protein